MSLIQKPEPLILGNKAMYTLTSYDPVEVEVTVPAVTEEEIDMAIEHMVAEAGGTEKDLDNDAWVAEKFPGVASKDAFRAQMRSTLSSMNTRMAEEQKEQKCIEAITERLCQSVPKSFVDDLIEDMRLSFAHEAIESGMEPDKFLASMGLNEQAFEAMIGEQAKTISEQNAALDAYASEKKLKVSDDEIVRYMRVPADKVEEFFEEAKAAKQLDRLRDAAVRSKAVNSIVAECSCTYNHETPEQTAKRLAELRAYMDARKRAGAAGNDKGDSGFKLV